MFAIMHLLEAPTGKWDADYVDQMKWTERLRYKNEKWVRSCKTRSGMGMAFE